MGPIKNQLTKRQQLATVTQFATTAVSSSSLSYRDRHPPHAHGNVLSFWSKLFSAVYNKLSLSFLLTKLTLAVSLEKCDANYWNLPLHTRNLLPGQRWTVQWKRSAAVAQVQTERTLGALVLYAVVARLSSLKWSTGFTFILLCAEGGGGDCPSRVISCDNQSSPAVLWMW